MPLVIYTVLTLHNVCVDFNVPEPDMSSEYQARFRALKRSSDVLPEAGRRRDRESAALRQSLAAELAGCGMCRPPVAALRRGAA